MRFAGRRFPPAVSTAALSRVLSVGPSFFAPPAAADAGEPFAPAADGRGLGALLEGRGVLAPPPPSAVLAAEAAAFHLAAAFCAEALAAPARVGVQRGDEDGMGDFGPARRPPPGSVPVASGWL